jgi:hypothetical protein
MIMNLIDRYVAELGKHLPMKNRTDIQNEIRSTLEDMLADRSQTAGGEASEEMVVELLKEYGNPEDVAASYLPERHLIGPQMYPIFLLVVTIALPILATVLLITMSIGLFTAGLTTIEVLKTIGSILLEVAGALVSAFGSIVITFAILERIPWSKSEFSKDKEEESKTWNPRDLPEVQDVEKFSIPGLVAEVAFTGIALVVFNFFPQIIGFGFLLNDKWTFLPLLSDAFFRYLPYLTGLWVLQIVLNLILLRRGRWETATRWLHFTLTGLGIALAVFMLAGPDLIGSTGEALSAVGPNFSTEAANILTWIPRIMVKVALFLSIVFNGLDMLKFLIGKVTGKSRS